MATISKTLLATTSPVASVDVLAASAALAGVPVGCADVLTHAVALTVSTTLPGSYDSVVLHSDAAISDAASWLGALGRYLKPSGTLVVASVHQDAATLPLQLKLAGFVNIQSDATKVTASKPGYETGATASISLKKPVKASWKLDDTDELIDEDELLTEEDRARPAPASDDCDVGASGRKACKNCTCGRAEQEAQGVKLTKDMLDNPQSSCGNCALGDAFRCASCPYKGLPPFEAGKKIQLGADLLAADV